MSRFHIAPVFMIGLAVGASLGTAPTRADTLPAPVPRAILSPASAWGTAADSWAGYTGQLALWVPAAVSGGWTLQFRSAALGGQVDPASFWNASARYDPATQVFTLKSPDWGGSAPANGVLRVGFNGRGVLDPGFALEHCVFNGQPCAAAVMTRETAEQTLAALQAGGTAPGPAPGTGGGTGNPPAPVTNPALELLLSVNESWTGGYSGQLVVKNRSGQALAAGESGWQARLKFPDQATARDVFLSGPWNLRAEIGADGTVILRPMAWAAALPAGATVASGFNGGTPANLLKAASGDPAVSVLFAAGATPPDDETPTDPPPPDDSIGLPTGAVSGGFLFSPYKDVGISMNWNTNLISTAVSGSPQPLLAVLPAGTPAVTWAFATGECGRENWAGIPGADLAAANVARFSAADRDYVLSTGGAAGAFHCASPEGMRAFINRYASKNLVGVDFDIEAGQSAAAIDSLVAQVAAVQADYPGLRFSFTLATLGSANGQSATSPYGDLNVTGYQVLQALSRHPVTNYTINLMVMDYGAAGPGVCVLRDAVCDMGQTALQAARNLTARFGIPAERIELTPMIGMNDVTDEIFSLEDVDTLTRWARANHLAGLHFWSVDRDRPCQQSSASPICSSVPTVPAWGWTRRFLAALGL